MSKHTPGPWEWVESMGGRNMPSLRSTTCEVCNFGDDGPYYPVEGEPPSEADMRLIAAAPDLLEALWLCFDHCRLYYPEVEHNNVGDAVRAAISKATGEQS